MVYDRCFSYFYCTAGVTGSDNAGIYGGHYRTGTDAGQWTLITGIAVAVLLVVVAICLALVIPKFKKVQTLTDDQSRFSCTEVQVAGARAKCVSQISVVYAIDCFVDIVPAFYYVL